MKVVTGEEGGEIACIGRWNFFPHGYDFAKHHTASVTNFLPPTAQAPEGPFRVDLYREIVH
ncbi:hypothetical protein B0A55_13819, partial [Friedmanniomyces simplex]